jgi:uncharacterized phiE125 gp8 family phage protein
VATKLWSLHLDTPPAIDPVSLAEAKAHLRVDADADDTLIGSLIVAATEHAQQITSRAFITQTWDLWLDEWPKGGVISVPRPPLQLVNSIKYYDTAGTEAPWAAALYYPDYTSEPGRIAPIYGGTWPTTALREQNGVLVKFDAGYGDDAADVPEPIRLAMLGMIGHWYEHREAISDMKLADVPAFVDALLMPYRMVLV